MKNTYKKNLFLIMVSFLFLVIMTQNASASPYTLNAFDIWYDTGITLNNSLVTFSNAQTGFIDSPRYFEDPDFPHPDPGLSNQWTWGIRWYFNNGISGSYISPQYFDKYNIAESERENYSLSSIPYVWTDADGSYGDFWVLDDSNFSYYGMDLDEWYRGPGASHGQLIGYIGYENPFNHENDTDFRNLVFGIGTSTVSMIGTGNVWIGINDAFDDIDGNKQDNSGFVTVNIEVPEPATMLLLGLGLLGIAGIRSAGRSWKMEKA